VSLKNRVAVVALLIGWNEVRIYLFLCFTYLNSKSWYFFKISWFDAYSIQFAFFHLLFFIKI